MIIKSMSRKMPSFDQLSSYMLAAPEAEIALHHNLPARAQDEPAIVSAFQENYRHLPSRANGNALFHEIISLEPDLQLPIKEQVKALTAIAQEYLDKRAPTQLAVGVIHQETAHLHIHLMISSNGVYSRKREWLTKKEFATIQAELEAYQLKHYPELGQAQHYGQERTGIKQTNREQSAKQRTGKPSHKEQLASQVAAAMKEVNDQATLDTKLADLGLSLYQRGRSIGLITQNGRRYRLGTLDLNDTYTETMTRIELYESRLAQLERPSFDREHDRER